MTAEDSTLQMSNRYSLSTLHPVLAGLNLTVHLRENIHPVKESVVSGL